MGRSGVVLLALALSVGCGSETALLVEVQSDLSVPDAVDQLGIAAVGSRSGESLVEVVNVSDGFPHSYAIHAGSDLSEEVTITVTARKRSMPSMSVGEFVTQGVVIDSFVSGEVRTVRVVLEVSCVGVMCPSGQTCMGGMCIEVERDAGIDAGMDGGREAGPRDGGPDAHRDAGVDAGRDAGLRDGGRDAGTCSVMCEGRMVCGADGCVDTVTDPRHCGGCGMSCAAGRGCSGRTCRPCGLGFTLCGLDCMHANDVRHCGGCAGGVRCGADQICSGGTCAAAGPGQSCATPDDLGSATGLVSILTMVVDRHTHLGLSCLDDDAIKEGTVLRWTAPSTGTYRFAASFRGSGMGPLDAAIQLYAGGDTWCSCPLRGGCAGASVYDPTVQVDRAVSAGESLLVLLATGRATVAPPQLTISAL